MIDCGRPGHANVRREGVSGNRHDARHCKPPAAGRGESVATPVLSHPPGLFRPCHMNIAIVGGTGTVGAEAARELSARGHDVRVLSRHAPEYPVDLTDGSGLARALAGVEVVVDASQGGRDVLVEGTGGCWRPSSRRACGTMSASRSSASTASAGATTRPSSTRRRRSSAPASRGRSCARPSSTRSWPARSRPAPGSACCRRRGVPLQPVDPREVGRALADTAEAEPSRAITQFAGPEVARRARARPALARVDRVARAAAPVPVPRSLRAGGLTNPAAWRGRSPSTLAGVMTAETLAERFEARGRGCCGSPTATSAASPRPRMSCRTRGCGCSASMRTRSATCRAG